MSVTQEALQRKQEALVLEYLEDIGDITSMKAWEEFGITRLSSVIYRLRKTHIIDTIPTEGLNRDGFHTRFATYVYRGKK